MKLDGIRAIVINGVVMSRSLKPIPNAFVQEKFGGLEHYDGELIVGEPTGSTCYRDTVSHVMSHDKRGYPVRFFAFDHVEHTSATYHTRHGRLREQAGVVVHEQTVLTNLAD